MPTPTLPDQPFYQDGNAAVTDYAIEILNLALSATTYQQLLYVSDDIAEDAMHEAHVGPDGEGEGSYTGTVDQTGNIVAQLDTASSTVPRPGYIIRFRDQLYQIIGKPAQSRQKNQTVRVTLPVKRLIHPCLANLLSADGPVLSRNVSSGVSLSPTITPGTLSNRTGETYAYAVGTDYDALPTGLSLNASTGAISGSTTQTGTRVVKIVCTATKANAATRTGIAWVRLVVA